jgi:hypothetical protein
MEVDSGIPVPGTSKPKHDIIIKQEVIHTYFLMFLFGIIPVFGTSIPKHDIIIEQDVINVYFSCFDLESFLFLEHPYQNTISSTNKR